MEIELLAKIILVWSPWSCVFVDARVEGGQFHGMAVRGMCQGCTAAFTAASDLLEGWVKWAPCQGYSRQTQVSNPYAEPHAAGKQTNFVRSEEYPSGQSTFWTRGHPEQVEFLSVDAMRCTLSNGKICVWWWKWANEVFENLKTRSLVFFSGMGVGFCSWLTSLGEAIWKRMLVLKATNVLVKRRV